MKIKIPGMNAGPEYDALADCIDYAANGTQLSDERVFAAVSLFMERVADHMCAGHVVPFPSFGKWGAWLEERKVKTHRHNQGNPYCVPVFVAARPLREQVKTTAPCNASAREALRGLRRNASRARPTHSRFHADTKRHRDAIAAQLLGD